MTYPLASQIRVPGDLFKPSTGSSTPAKPGGGKVNGGSSFNPNAGDYTDRKRRHEARAARRDGDWGFLEFPVAALWFEAYETVEAEELGLLPPPIIDLWP
jgi:hypothetical protein